MKFNLDDFEKMLNSLQEKNIKLLKKTSRFGIWILINGLMFSFVLSIILKVFDYVGFEKTLIIVLMMIFFSQVRQQFERA